MSGTELISIERQRQIKEEGWTSKHDDAHQNDELALAAATYALPDNCRTYLRKINLPTTWPWDEQWWKPSRDCIKECERYQLRIRELVKAGALIAAEIDRLQRIHTTLFGDDDV